MNNHNNNLGNIGAGVCLLVLAVFELMSGEQPSGFLSGVLGPLYERFGVAGPAGAYALIGCAFIAYGLMRRRQK